MSTRKQRRAHRDAARRLAAETHRTAQTARWERDAADRKARRGQNVTVTNGFALGFSIFWGFFVGGLIVAVAIFMLNLLGLGLLLGL